MAIVITALFTLSVIIIISAVEHAGRVKRDNVLDRLARVMDGQRTEIAVTGVRRGVTAIYRFQTRGHGKAAQQWTEVEAELPNHYPLAIHIRRHGFGDERRIASGQLVDVQLGDPAFDAAFLLEIAPSDVARLLLDQPMRTLLREYDPVELETVTFDNRRLLRFAFRSWCLDPAIAIRLVDLIAGTAARVRDVYRKVEAATPVETVGSPYRELVDDTAARDAANARAREVRELEELRAQRPSGDVPPSVIGLIIIIIITVMTMVAAGRH